MGAVIYSGTPDPAWTTLETTDAEAADREIRKHLDCEILDTESIAFTCYSCSVTVRWIG
jgi:hypothetical protein